MTIISVTKCVVVAVSATVKTNPEGDNSGDIDDSDGCSPCDYRSGLVKMFQRRCCCSEVCDETNAVNAWEAHGFQCGVCDNP